MLKLKHPLTAIPILRVIGIMGILLIIIMVGSCTTTNVASQPIATETEFLPSLPTEIIDAKGLPMRLVPAGEFTMGSDNDSDNRNQEHRVYLDAFYMDKYEVTNAHYAACVRAGVCEPPQDTKSYFRPSYYGDHRYDNFPVIFVD